jgi:hypothetical protein
MQWHKQNPDDWQKTWELVEAKYQDNTDYRRFSCGGPTSAFNIDAKINGAYIVIGLLYGEGDLAKTIVISTRCGQDSDCNPANSGGIIGTVLGRSRLPEEFTSAIDPNGKFSHTPYTFPALVEVSEKLVRQAVVRAGGRIEKDAAGNEVLVIPVESPKPSKLEQCWEPGPAAESKFDEEEMDKISSGSVAKQLQAQVDQVLPGWKLTKCGPDMDPGLRAEYLGRNNVLMTHPLDRQTGCVLSKKVDLPAGKETALRIVVANDTRGDFTLEVKANGKSLLKKKVGDEDRDGAEWVEMEVLLSDLAGKSVELELINRADDWRFEAAYWAQIALESK